MPAPLNRRDLLTRALALGLLAGPGAPLLTGCAFGGGGEQQPTVSGQKSSANPLGVPAGQPLDVVIFKGGYGDEYAVRAEQTYRERFPGAEVKHQGIQKIKETLQPRFVAGEPPDVVDSTGPSSLNLAGLASDKQLLDLKDLLAAPSYDDPNRTVEQTLLPGVVEIGTFNGPCYVLNYAYTVFGIWYSQPLFRKHGWEYPKTWEQLLALCSEIQRAGIAPWTYQGKNPEYFLFPLLAMAAKTGGTQVLVDLDNLEPRAWQSDAMLAAAEAVHQLAVRNFILPGSDALSHTEAQTQFVQGKAAFLPCGSWLDSEMKSVTPPGFDMVVAPTPSVTGTDKLPFTAIMAAAAESFIVPSRARNPHGGLEYLRILLSKPAARRFSELTGALSSVAGAADGVEAGSALRSSREAVAAAGDHTVLVRFVGWYLQLYQEVSGVTGELVTGRISPADWAKRCQQAADGVAADSRITKYRR